MKRGWWIALGGCFLAAIVSELPEMILLALNDAPLRAERLLPSILRWALWGTLFGPPLYRFARRANVVWTIAVALPVMFVYQRLASTPDFFQPVILFTLTAGYGVFAQNEERRVAAERARLDAERRFSAARLEMLRSELQPHFLFNTLNTVASLALREPEKAAAVAEKLRDLFRATSGDALPQVTSVEAEVDLTKKYVDIQQARFEERLRTSFTISPGAERARIPALLLQPLVENAIRHGMTRREGITLEVHIARDGDELHITVDDDGAADERPIVEGVGLSNTRARLQAMHGERASFNARRKPAGGFVVDVRIPYDDAEIA